MEADSAAALEALLDGHPHLQLDGAAIEGDEFLPLPGMRAGPASALLAAVNGGTSRR